MLILNLVMTLFIGVVHADFSIAPKPMSTLKPTVTHENCYAGKLPFFQNFSRTVGDPFEKMNQLENACVELSRSGWNEPKTAVEKIGQVLGGGVGGAATGHLAGAFDSLNGTPEQRRFKAELQRIK